MPHVVIVGAGISGLALAFRLQQQAPNLSVTVLEQDQRAGGKVGTLHTDGFHIEVGPNGFLDNKPSTLSLCRDLGLESHLVPASAAAAQNRYLFWHGRLQALPTGVWSFLGSPLLSWRSKLDLVLERFRQRPPPGGDETIAAFARRRTNAEIAEVLADAIVTGIHAGDPELLSLPAAFPRLAELERQFGSVLGGLAATSKERWREARSRGEEPRRTGQMWSCREGLGLVVDNLADRLRPVLGVSIAELGRDGDPARPTWSVAADGRERWNADAVVLACPAYQQARLLAELDAELAERLAGIAYNRIAVVALGYRAVDVPRPLDGFGYIAPQASRRDLLGVQWCSSIFPGRAPEGAVLLRALAGGWNRPDVVSWTDERLLAAMREELRLSLGITAAPIMHRIIRWNRAIPQYHVGHLERVSWIEQRLVRHPGLFLAGNAFHGVALNDCTEQAESLAAKVLAYVAAPASIPHAGT